MVKINLNGNEIKKLRKRIGLTQQEFADEIGITHNYLSDIERGKKKPSDIILKSIWNRYGGDNKGKQFTPVTWAQELNIRENVVYYDNALEKIADDNLKDVISSVIKIMQSRNIGIINALMKNVQEFSRAVDTAEELKSCLERIAEMQKQIDDLSKKVNRLTARPAGSAKSGDSSE